LSRDSNGNAVVNRTPAVTGQTVSAEQVNVPFADIQAMLNLVLWRDGISPWTGSQNANGFRLKGLPDAAEPQEPATYAQLSAVQSSINQVAPTGLVGMFRRKTPPTGWIVEGGTIGNISSGADYAQINALNLFSLMWTTFSNTEISIYNSSGAVTTRGVSAVEDWNANKRIALFDPRSRFPRAADYGLGYDISFGVGTYQDDMTRAHTHTVNENPHDHAWGNGAYGSGVNAPGTGAGVLLVGAGDLRTTSATTGISINSTGGSETRGRSSGFLFCIKL